ncbi:hypothetical protein THASP1DRAFT_29945 [Thamnocephalis sphaerospora]|uniref:Uncharacterized protein n=1 Tax=Thamnocephalis sphaerospora TaxID=78915 RepID=A0A4V1IWP2_9FUNG|nr:hypothetical protein THASP1DRAFT_29945 [Thamnocephalis sphaerospora]|eukprot:RKP08249.1 hypothetical protein THASP1DRAFT_29945 [Thamnocephalis sphaerospora]
MQTTTPAVSLAAATVSRRTHQVPAGVREWQNGGMLAQARNETTPTTTATTHLSDASELPCVASHSNVDQHTMHPDVPAGRERRLGVSSTRSTEELRLQRTPQRSTSLSRRQPQSRPIDASLASQLLPQRMMLNDEVVQKSRTYPPTLLPYNGSASNAEVRGRPHKVPNDAQMPLSKDEHLQPKVSSTTTPQTAAAASAQHMNQHLSPMSEHLSGLYAPPFMSIESLLLRNLHKHQKQTELGHKPKNAQAGARLHKPLRNVLMADDVALAGTSSDSKTLPPGPAPVLPPRSSSLTDTLTARIVPIRRKHIKRTGRVEHTRFASVDHHVLRIDTSEAVTSGTAGGSQQTMPQDAPRLVRTHERSQSHTTMRDIQSLNRPRDTLVPPAMPASQLKAGQHGRLQEITLPIMSPLSPLLNDHRLGVGNTKVAASGAGAAAGTTILPEAYKVASPVHDDGLKRDNSRPVHESTSSVAQGNTGPVPVVVTAAAETAALGKSQHGQGVEQNEGSPRDLTCLDYYYEDEDEEDETQGAYSDSEIDDLRQASIRRISALMPRFSLPDSMTMASPDAMAKNTSAYWMDMTTRDNVPRPNETHVANLTGLTRVLPSLLLDVPPLPMHMSALDSLYEVQSNGSARSTSQPSPGLVASKAFWRQSLAVDSQRLSLRPAAAAATAAHLSAARSAADHQQPDMTAATTIASVTAHTLTSEMYRADDDDAPATPPVPSLSALSPRRLQYVDPGLPSPVPNVPLDAQSFMKHCVWLDECMRRKSRIRRSRPRFLFSKVANALRAGINDGRFDFDAEWTAPGGVKSPPPQRITPWDSVAPVMRIRSLRRSRSIGDDWLLQELSSGSSSTVTAVDSEPMQSRQISPLQSSSRPPAKHSATSTRTKSPRDAVHRKPRSSSNSSKKSSKPDRRKEAVKTAELKVLEALGLNANYRRNDQPRQRSRRKGTS